jgi:hypothetical protein
VIETVRWYVLIVSVIVAAVGGPGLWRRWPTYKIENKYMWLAVVVLNFAIGYGTAEALWLHVPGGPRNLLFVPAETWLLVAVAYHPFEDFRRWRRVRRVLRSTSRNHRRTTGGSP